MTAARMCKIELLVEPHPCRFGHRLRSLMMCVVVASQENAEAVRVAAYNELYRTEDEVHPHSSHPRL